MESRYISFLRVFNEKKQKLVRNVVRKGLHKNDDVLY